MLPVSIALATALIGAPVVLAVEDPGNLSAEPLGAVIERLAGEIERRTGDRCATVLSLPEGCVSDRCLAELRARGESEDVVLVRTFASPSLIRVIAERIGPVRTGTASADVPREPLGAGQLAALAASLFPEARARADTAAFTAAGGTGAASGPRWLEPLPLVVLATAVVAIAAGTGFAVASERTRSSIEEKLLFEHEYAGASGRLEREAWTANALFGAAGVALIGWGAMLLLD